MHRLRVHALAFVLVALASAARAQEPDAAVTGALAEVERLASMDDGSGIGVGGDPGRFFELRRLLAPRVTRAQIEALVASPRPVTRVMGLACAARRLGRAAIPLVRSRLGSPSCFFRRPGGCDGVVASEAGVARDFLRALLDERERLALDIALLASDAYSVHRPMSSYPSVSHNVSRALSQGALAPTLAALGSAGPGLPDVALVKAIGRLTPEPVSRDALLGWLRARTLPLDVRLAAASGLTRDGEPAVRDALETVRGELDAATGRDVGTSFVRAFDLRRMVAERFALIDKDDTPLVFLPIRLLVLGALAVDHPLAFEVTSPPSSALHLPCPARGARDEGARATRDDALRRMGLRAAELSAPWDTYGDVAVTLELVAECLREEARWGW